MMRMSSISHINKSNKKSIDNRTTKTKASAAKPEVFGISLARNKNNPTPVLFYSIKKNHSNDKENLVSNDQNNNCKTEKQKKYLHSEPNILDELNTRISVNYINSLYSDLAVHFGCQLKDQLSSKQNILKEKNTNISVGLGMKQQKQCLQKIRKLIVLKDEINEAYNSMKNSQHIFTFIQNRQQEQDSRFRDCQFGSLQESHQSIDTFINHFTSIQQQLSNLQQQYQQQSEIQKNQIQDQIQEEQLDSLICKLKEEIANQKKLCLRFEREEKFLINKLYFTQRKNNDLRASSSNLKIKNTNLRDTLRLSAKKTKDPDQSPKPHRSFSLKLQRVKRFNLEEPISIAQNSQTERKVVRSKSTSSLNNANLTSYLSLRQKQTFLDKIY